MIAAEQQGVLAVQAEVACLGALLRCVRVASENGQPSTLIESAIAACEDVATGIADRMDKIEGLYPRTEGSR
jgi:hypothetical protein